MSLLADPRGLIRRTVATVMEPPPPADLTQWGERNIVFGNESPVPGPFSRDTIPPMTRILECLSPDHPCRVVAVKGSAQIFKTTLAQIFIGALMDTAPAHMLYTHPTHDNALRWARGKWRTMRNKSRALKRIFGEAKSRDTTDTTLYQEHRLGLGSLTISGANSPASLSMISTPYIVEDDLAKWEMNTAGDPEAQADNRAEAFDWAKILKISTPLFAKTCRITRAYKQGTQEKYHVPCPHCDHFQPLDWTNFQASINPEHPEDAHFTCVSCGRAIEHKHKRSIIARGKWVAENQAAKDPSFYIWRAYSPSRDWASIARKWLQVQGDPKAEQTFYNDWLGLEYELASEAPPWEEIRDRSNEGDNTYPRGVIPPGGLVIIAGVDCQGDRLEVHIKAFGANLRRFTIDYRVIPYHISSAEARSALDLILKETWRDAFGNKRPIDMLAIDGNAYTKDVFMWARRHPWTRVIVVRGAKSELAPPLALTQTEKREDGKTRKAQKRFYNVGVAGLKGSLYEQLKKIDVLARGYCGYPKGLDDEFYRQLCAEKREIVKSKWGYPVAVWRKDHDRNEVLDTEMYAEAAAIRCGWYTKSDEEWDRLRAVREAPAPVDQAELFEPAAAPVVSTQGHIGRPDFDAPVPARPAPPPPTDDFLGDVPDNFL